MANEDKKNSERPGRRPKAVCISDIHFTVSTLDLASSALEQAIHKAQDLGVPLVIAGDLMDSKAIIRGEVANRIIAIIGNAKCQIFVIPGNHDKINEKGEEHSLNFLRPYSHVISYPTFVREVNAQLIPYQGNTEALKIALAACEKGSTIIMHQGVLGADMGHYIQDRSSLSRDHFADFRVISGHYHKAQDIKCGRPRKGAVGLFSYIGSPYTISFAEANDGPKGFRVLYDDGLLELAPTNLRKHIKAHCEVDEGGITDGQELESYNPGDKLWVVLRGPKTVLDKIKKEDFQLDTNDFKLEKIPADLAEPGKKAAPVTDSELLDKIIDRTSESDGKKAALKKLWREVLS